MTTVDKTIEIEVPVRTAYNQWTQFEDFPHFMEGVKQVSQMEDARLFWAAELGGQEKEWYARITRQVPDEVLAWESEGGARNNGTIIFHPKDGNKTEIEVHMDYDPEDFKEQVGGALGFLSRRVDADLKRFKEFIENRGTETGGWRGEIIHGANADPASQLFRETPTQTAHDPVCHMDIELATAPASVELSGMTQYFCSEECKERFIHDPQAFLNLEAGFHR